jgi:prepilin signal peptidase PulO-like enzyme (type II secretory pathway)
VSHVLVAAAWALVGAVGGWGVRWASVRLARLEELEPARAAWAVYGPPILSAALFAIFGYQLSPNLAATAELDVFVLVLVQVIFFDLEHALILDRVVFPSMALALVVSLFRQPWWAGIAAGAVIGLAFLLLGVVGSALMKADALGFGDIKLAVFLGLLLGPIATAEAVLLGFLLAGMFAIAIAVVRRSLQGGIALGPYLAAGALIALYYRNLPL